MGDPAFLVQRQPARSLGFEIGAFQDGHAVPAQRPVHRLLGLRAASRATSRRRRSRSGPNVLAPARSRANCSRSTSGATESSTWNKSPAGPRTRTSARTRIIRDNLDKSPMYFGQDRGRRVRATARPSRTRWSSLLRKPRHQLFLEPEGRHTREYYVNGISTSLPYEVQLGVRPEHPRGWNARRSSGPATPWNTIIARRPSCGPTLETKRWRTCFSPDRSTARAVTKKPPRRASSPGSTPAGASLGQGEPFVLGRSRSVHRRAGGRPRDQGHERAVPHVHQPRRTPPSAARRQRRRAPHRPRARSSG